MTNDEYGEATSNGGRTAARPADATARGARRILIAMALLGAVAFATPGAANAFPGFYVPGPRFYAPHVYAPPIYVPAPPDVYVPAPPVYYAPRPRIHYYAPYRVRRPRFHP